MVSRVTDKGQNLNKQILYVSKASHIPYSKSYNKEKKKTHDCINIFLALLAKEIIRYLAMFFLFSCKTSTLHLSQSSRETLQNKTACISRSHGLSPPIRCTHGVLIHLQSSTVWAVQASIDNLCWLFTVRVA